VTVEPARSAPAGPSVLLTRPRPQAEAMARVIADAGMCAMVFPTLDIVPVRPDAPEEGSWDCIVFVSTNAVEQGFRWAIPAGAVPPGTRVAAIGAATAAALRERGVAAPIVPTGAFDTESLLSLPAFARVAGWRVLVVRGVGGREALADGLRARGAEVRYLECYRRICPAADPRGLLDAWRAGGIDAVNAMSAETLSNLLALIGAAGAPLAAATPLFAPHERIANQARAWGIAEAVVYRGGDPGLVEGLRARFPARAVRAS
jgi:uroporphyrinogen-III synthase